MPAARQPAVSRSSFRFARPSAKFVMAILLVAFFTLHVIAAAILQERTETGAAPARQRASTTSYD